MTLPHVRELVRALRDGWGVADATPGHGGKHPFVKFTDPRTGASRRLTLGHDKRQRSLTMALADVRRLLGPPTQESNGKPKQTLEQMMPEPFNPVPLVALQETPSTTLDTVDTPPPQCWVAIYHDVDSPSGQRGRVFATSETAAAMRGPIEVKRVDEDTWQLRVSPTERRHWTRASAVRCSLDIGYEAVSGLIPFGTSLAECAWVDGTLVVHSPSASRRPTGVGVPTPRARATPRPTSNTTLDRDQMIAVLREIAQIEQRTGWRLARGEPNVWEWRPPHVEPIRLQE